MRIAEIAVKNLVYASPGADRIAIQLPECIYENENLNGLPNKPVVLSSNAPVYGSRGEYFLQPNEKYVPSDDKTILAKRYAGLKRFELKDHLGSVRATVADAKIGGFGEPVSEALPVTSIGNYLPYGADIKSLSYFYVPNASSNYPFIHGKSDIMPIGPYSFGFDGMKREGKDIDGNYNTAFREYDVNTGRWGSLDPKPTASESWYAGMGCNPVNNVDPLGDTIVGVPGMCIIYRV